MKRRCIKIPNGIEKISKILDTYRNLLYKYNSLISNTGFYLKPVHVVTRKLDNGERRTYYYYGRYWWKITYAGKKGKTSKVQWKYVGKSKPIELQGYPDPPRNPLEGLRYYTIGNDIILSETIYRRFKRILGDNIIVVEC